MSIAERAAVASSKNIIYRTFVQRNDILRTDGVRTELIAFLHFLIRHGALLEVTALKSDHSDDLGKNSDPLHCGTHAAGWAIDCWPLAKPMQGAYLDPSDEQFQHFLRLAQQGPFFKQTGLGGTADTDLNKIAAGPTYFPDGYYDDFGDWISEDHVHFGTKADEKGNS